MGVRYGYRSWQICLFYPMIKPFQGVLPLVEENPLICKIISLHVETENHTCISQAALPDNHSVYTRIAPSADQNN